MYRVSLLDQLLQLNFLCEIIESSTGPTIPYSFNQVNAVSYNTTIIFDTNAGTFTG